MTGGFIEAHGFTCSAGINIDGGRCSLAMAAMTRSAKDSGSSSGHWEIAETVTPIRRAAEVTVPPSMFKASFLSMLYFSTLYSLGASGCLACFNLRHAHVA